MSELTPRERRQQRTYDAILDAARTIITEKGINALSIRAIAAAIDYSPAGLYEYFGSKEEILGALIEQGFQLFTDTLERVDTTLPPEAYMIELGMAYVKFAVQNPDFFLLMFTTYPLQPEFALDKDCTPKDQIVDQPSFGVLYKGVQRCIDEGVFIPSPSIGTFEMAYAAWTNVHGIAMLRITTLKVFPLDYEQVDRMAIQAMILGWKAMQ